MNVLKTLFLLFCALTLLTLVTACEEQGPAEKAGEKIDNMVEKTQEKMENAGEEVKEGIDKTGEKIEEAGEKLQDKTN